MIEYIGDMVGHTSHIVVASESLAFWVVETARKPSLILGRRRAAWQICPKSQYFQVQVTGGSPNKAKHGGFLVKQRDSSGKKGWRLIAKQSVIFLGMGMIRNDVSPKNPPLWTVLERT